MSKIVLNYFYDNSVLVADIQSALTEICQKKTCHKNTWLHCHRYVQHFNFLKVWDPCRWTKFKYKL